MKNVEETFSKRPVFRVPMKGAPPLQGYFVRYVSGMDKADIKPGYWLTQFYIDRDDFINFNFGPDADLHWDTEGLATAVTKILRESAEIETSVVKIGT